MEEGNLDYANYDRDDGITPLIERAPVRRWLGFRNRSLTMEQALLELGLGYNFQENQTGRDPGGLVWKLPYRGSDADWAKTIFNLFSINNSKIDINQFVVRSKVEFIFDDDIYRGEDKGGPSWQVVTRMMYSMSTDEKNRYFDTFSSQ